METIAALVDTSVDVQQESLQTQRRSLRVQREILEKMREMNRANPTTRAGEDLP